MKTYDFAKAKQLIEENKDNIESAYLGMSEDWSWTAVAVFKDGEFTMDLDEQPEIAGIKSSSWATPELRINFKDGNSEEIECLLASQKKVVPHGYNPTAKESS